VFIDVRKPRLDPCPLAVRERLQGRVRFFGFCKWMFPRARPGTFRTSRATGRWSGRLRVRSKVAFRPGNRRRCAGSGVENTVPRHSPSRLLATETSPQPRSLRAPLVAGTGLFPVRSDVGRGRCRHAARACKARVAGGSCDARSPRRDRTFTNPRGLPSLAVRDANGEASFRTGKLPGDRVLRFFHHQKNPHEGRSSGP